jgi:hypothetical protein
MIGCFQSICIRLILDDIMILFSAGVDAQFCIDIFLYFVKQLPE